MPQRDETLTASSPVTSVALGGKGANQAVAAARMLPRTPHAHSAHFVGKFGNDAYSAMLQQVLQGSGLQLSHCEHTQLSSGQGLVLLEADGAVTSVVVGGANTAWAHKPESYYQQLLMQTNAQVNSHNRKEPSDSQLHSASCSICLSTTA